MRVAPDPGVGAGGDTGGARARPYGAAAPDLRDAGASAAVAEVAKAFARFGSGRASSEAPAAGAPPGARR